MRTISSLISACRAFFLASATGTAIMPFAISLQLAANSVMSICPFMISSCCAALAENDAKSAFNCSALSFNASTSSVPPLDRAALAMSTESADALALALFARAEMFPTRICRSRQIRSSFSCDHVKFPASSISDLSTDNSALSRSISAGAFLICLRISARSSLAVVKHREIVCGSGHTSLRE